MKRRRALKEESKGRSLGVRNTDRAEARAEARRSIRELMGNIGQYGGSPKEKLMLSDKLSMMAHSSIDVGYIKTLLFPELYNADIP